MFTTPLFSSRSSHRISFYTRSSANLYVIEPSVKGWVIDGRASLYEWDFLQ